jgi:hypothetical protein
MDIMAKWNSIVPTFSKENKEHRLLLLQVIMKAADISNPVKPFPIAKYWANMVQEEFFAQVRVYRIFSIISICDYIAIKLAYLPFFRVILKKSAI